MRSKSSVRFVLFVVLVLVSVLAIGCKGEDPGDGTAGVSPLPQQTISPGVADSPLALPSEEIDFEVEPAPGKVVLKGTIKITQSTIVLGELFLAKAVPTSDPDIELLSLDTETAPRASIDRATGRFIYVDVEPGRYGLVVWEPMTSAPVNDPQTGQTLYIDLLPDQIAEVGELVVP